MIELRAGDYVAQVTAAGAALVTLRYGGRDLVRHTGDVPPMPPYRGAVLVPWPNRIADGRYSFAGQTHQLPINEVERRCALHGLLLWNSWQVDAVEQAYARMSETIWPRPGYPFTLHVTVEYRLGDGTGMDIAVTARNVGATAAPYGASVHPYLVGGAGCVDGWTFELPAAQVLDVDPDRLLPLCAMDVAGSAFDFRVARRIGSTAIDHAFTRVRFDERGRAAATLRGPEGTGVRIEWDERCRWVQVHTTELPGDPVHRRGLAVEPMTAPPDCFNSAEGLITLQPDGSHTFWSRISQVGPGEL